MFHRQIYASNGWTAWQSWYGYDVLKFNGRLVAFIFTDGARPIVYE